VSKPAKFAAPPDVLRYSKRAISTGGAANAVPAQRVIIPRAAVTASLQSFFMTVSSLYVCPVASMVRLEFSRILLIQEHLAFKTYASNMTDTLAIA
jgi:hypothetical protein